MVDCRSPGAVDDKHETPHMHGTSADNHHNQLQAASGDNMVPPHSNPGAPPMNVPPPTLHNHHHTYPHPGLSYMSPPVVFSKGLCWLPPAFKSVQLNGSDLPMNDIPTLRYYYNLGVDSVWGAYYPQRHYTPHDLTQEMAQLSMGERAGPPPEHKHAPPQPDNKHQHNTNNHKGNGQRTIMGPRFKRNNFDGNQNMNHNKNYNNHNNMQNKPSGPHNNFRRQPEQPVGDVVPMPYVQYSPIYSYYPMEHDPNMMGMMGNMSGFVNYEESVEYVQQQYYPHYSQPQPHALPALPPAPPQPPQPPQTHQPPPQQQQHNNEHK